MADIGSFPEDAVKKLQSDVMVAIDDITIDLDLKAHAAQVFSYNNTKSPFCDLTILNTSKRNYFTDKFHIVVLNINNTGWK